MLTNILLLHIPVPCWLPLLLACILPFLLGLLLGWLLWGRRKNADGSSSSKLSTESPASIQRASELEKELIDVKYQLEECQKENNDWHKKPCMLKLKLQDCAQNCR